MSDPSLITDTIQCDRRQQSYDVSELRDTHGATLIHCREDLRVTRGMVGILQDWNGDIRI